MDSSKLQKYQEELMQYYNIQKNKAQDSTEEKTPEPDSAEISERYPEPEIEQLISEETTSYPIDSGLPETYSEYGKLRIETTSGNRSVPVEDVLVIVTRGKTEPGEVLAVLMTDRSGSTKEIEISAPSRQRSEAPTERAVSSFVNITAFKEGYYEVENRNIPVFTGVTSIQPVNMIPLPINSGNRKVTYTDSEPNL